MNQEDLRAEIKNCLRESIEELRSIPIPTPPRDRISLIEACEITGFSRSLIYKMTMAGTIPHEKYGKRLIFSRKKLEEWVQSRTIPKTSPDEIMTNRLAETAKKRL